CLRALLIERCAENALNKPWKLIANFKAKGNSSAPQVASCAGAVLEATGVDGVLNDVYKQLCERIGLQPRGQLRIKVYVVGSSGDPLIDLHRTLDYSGDELEEFGSDAYWRKVAMEERAENFRLREQNNQLMLNAFQATNAAHGLLAQITVEQAKGFSQVATLRAQLGGLSEAGTVTSAAGIFVMLLGLPLLRQAFKIPAGAPLESIGELLAEQLKAAISGAPPPKARPAVRMTPAATAADPVQEPEAAPPAVVLTAEAVIAWLREDTTRIDELLALAMDDLVLMFAFQKSYTTLKERAEAGHANDD
ncbi:hypothetical protein L6R49_30435, partial [Myxococcota bacterium]|nr:hypothetical protein [Myxococcota bacterium]